MGSTVGSCSEGSQEVGVGGPRCRGWGPFWRWGTLPSPDFHLPVSHRPGLSSFALWTLTSLRATTSRTLTCPTCSSVPRSSRYLLGTPHALHSLG